MSDDRDSSSHDATSPVAAPGKEKRETLSERAARIIGKPLDEVQHEAESSQATGTGRRKQVLQAQRTHRLRTQLYIRELENEVFRLRDTEKELLAKIQNLEQRMSNGDSTSVHKDSTVPVEGSQASATPNRAPEDTIMNVDLTELANVPPIGSCFQHPDEVPRVDYVQPSNSQWPQTIKVANLNHQTAVNFILLLERPCLSHIKYTHLPPAKPVRTDIEFVSGPGHLLNLSSSLLHDYRLFEPEKAQLAVPEAEVERLLETSLKLPLLNEITPVQIWTRIKELSTQYAVSEQMLNMLGQEFEKYVRCNSFGAVVDEPIVQAILSNVFNLG